MYSKTASKLGFSMKFQISAKYSKFRKKLKFQIHLVEFQHGMVEECLVFAFKMFRVHVEMFLVVDQ